MSESNLKKPEEKKELKNLLSISGTEATIKGKIDVDECIDVNCKVDGEIKTNGKLIIQKDGHVKAEVSTLDAVISGRYEGNMKVTGKVEITKKGNLNGNVTTDNIVIADGGIFSGTVNRISDPNGKKIVKKRAATKKVATKTVRKKNTKKKVNEEIKKIEDFSFNYEK